jgi:hypothetical protein
MTEIEVLDPATARHHAGTEKHQPATRQTQKKAPKMKKFGFATIIASGLTAAVLGLAGPAQADSVHHDWVHDIQQQVTVPQVDTTVQQSR